MARRPESWKAFFARSESTAGLLETSVTRGALDLETLAPPSVVAAMTDAVAHGRPTHLRGVARSAPSTFDLDWFRRAAQRLGRRRPLGAELRACFSRGPKRTGPLMGVGAEQIGPLSDAGATVCVSNIHLADPRLAALAAHLKVRLGFSGLAGANCYFSPDGSGFHAHWDARVTTAIQLVGRKSWRYASAPAARVPLCNATYARGGADFSRNIDSPGADALAVEPQDERDFFEVTLEPGDVLVLPAGTWHSAEARGCSLAFNLYLQHQSFAASVADWIADHFAGEEAWRAGLPIGGLEDPSTVEAVRAYVRARADELVTALRDGKAVGAAFERTWLRQVTGGVSMAATSPIVATTELDSDHRLVVDRSIPMACRLVDGPEGRVAVLARGEYELSLDPSAFELLDRLCRTEAFVAGDACGWRRDADYAWEPVKALLSECERVGIVARARPEVRP